MKTDPPPQILDVNANDITAFVQVVFGYLDGFANIRLIGEGTGKDTKPQREFIKLDALSDRLHQIAGPAADRRQAVFVTPAAFDQDRRAGNADVTALGTLVVDLDDGDTDRQRLHLENSLGPASLIVSSGGRTGADCNRLHLYWRLTEAAVGEDLHAAVSARTLIAQKVGADGCFKSPQQPIRVSGTFHCKFEPPRLAAIIEHRTCEYELAELIERIGDMPALEGLQPPASGKTTGLTAKTLMTRPIHAEAQDELTRFEALSKVIGHWLRQHRLGQVTLDEAWTAVRDHNAALIRPPWSELRLRNEFDALLRVDQSKHQFGDGHVSMGNEDEDAGSKPVSFSEDQLANDLVRRHGKKLRYVPVWNRWFIWAGKRWVQDDKNKVFDLVRETCRATALRSENYQTAQRLSSEKTIRAVTRIAQTDPRVTCLPDDWDNDPWLLNTPDGVVDLRTGKQLQASPSHLLKKMTSVSPANDCPLWRAFLNRITGGDEEVIAYLQRVAGYCLTADTSEQMFLFLHGPGANGKSVFISVLGMVLGDYAATATLDTFMATRSGRHLSELAGLHGARLVAVPETEAGQTWSEARIKTVTGGEKIRANFMRQDHFEFLPGFKLIVAGNHRPRLSSTAEAMRRRLHALPLEVVIPPEERDLKLHEKLAAEADGILAWMIEGCRKWQTDGLNPPAIISETAANYLSEEDLIGHWLAECCEAVPASWEAARSLFSNWKTWAEDHGENPGSGRALGEALREKGYSSSRHRGKRGWSGIRLRHLKISEGGTS